MPLHKHIPFAALSAIVSCLMPTQALQAAPASAAVRTIVLPGVPGTGVWTDYLAYDRTHHRVWVPLGIGSVYVIDSGNDHVTRIQGFASSETEVHGRKLALGPTSV